MSSLMAAALFTSSDDGKEGKITLPFTRKGD